MDKIISIYWLAVMGIVATVIVVMVGSFYNAPYDVREVEARILSNTVADCVSSQGNINGLLFDGTNFRDDFKIKASEICGINLATEETWEGPQILFKAEVFTPDNLDNPIFDFYGGNLNFLSSCNIQQDDEFKNLAKCYTKKLYSTSGERQFLIKITSAVGKSEKNVK